MQINVLWILLAWEFSALENIQCTSYILSGGRALNVHTANQVRRRGYQESGLNRSVWQRPHQDMPGIRELGDESVDMTRRAERTPLLDAATKPSRTS